MVNKCFKTGGFFLKLESDEPILDSEFFPLFRVDDCIEPGLTVRVVRRALPEIHGECVLHSNHRKRIIAGGMTYDYTFFSDAAQLEHIPYACAYRQGARVTLFVDYDAQFWDSMIFEAIDLSDFFLEYDSAVVHASFIGYKDRGILFAGQKQTGKSTQAELWRTYRDATVINGDRVLVRKTDDGYRAFGVPFCGSSRICLNENRPVRAIVFPVKGEHNTVMPLSPLESFKRLIGCLTYTQEDASAAGRALKTAEEIVMNNECFLLVCRPDVDSVHTLAKELFGS